MDPLSNAPGLGLGRHVYHGVAATAQAQATRTARQNEEPDSKSCGWDDRFLTYSSRSLSLSASSKTCCSPEVSRMALRNVDDAGVGSFAGPPVSLPLPKTRKHTVNTTQTGRRWFLVLTRKCTLLRSGSRLAMVGWDPRLPDKADRAQET